MTSIRDEIIDILKDVYHNNDGGDPFDEHDADRILKLFEKRINSTELWCGECNDKALEKFKELLK